MRLVKPGSQIMAEMTPSKANLLHAAVGVAGEAGELLDAIKKHAIYNKTLDLENVIEELGDLEFFMEQIRQELRLSRDQTRDQNIRKLSVRYNQFKYSNEAAHERADKKVSAD